VAKCDARFMKKSARKIVIYDPVNVRISFSNKSLFQGPTRQSCEKKEEEIVSPEKIINK